MLLAADWNEMRYARRAALGSLMNISQNIDGQTGISPLGGGKTSPNSPLVDYALNGLQRCWMPEYGRWSHIYHLDGRSQPNVSAILFSHSSYAMSQRLRDDRPGENSCAFL